MLQAELSIPWSSMSDHCFLESCKGCIDQLTCQVRVALIMQQGGQLRHLVDVRGQKSRQIVDLLVGPEGIPSIVHPISRTHYLSVVETPVCQPYGILSASSCFLLQETAGAECLSWGVIGESVREVNCLVRELRKGGIMAAIRRIASVTGSSSLTVRQEEVLKLAYDYGFFVSTHETSVRQLAKALGCSPSTLDRLLRTAERKVIAEKFRTGQPSL